MFLRLLLTTALSMHCFVLVGCGGNNSSTSTPPVGDEVTVKIQGSEGDKPQSTKSDDLQGTDGDDRLFGGDGNDDIKGGSGNDYIVGNAGGDKLFGEAGADRIFGRDGNDRMFGGGGNDYMKGGSGDDTLSGDGGFDTLFGEGGADTFLFKGNWRRDKVADFENGVDRLGLSSQGLSGFSDLTIVQDGTTVIVSITGDTNNDIRLENTDIADIDAADFSF